MKRKIILSILIFISFLFYKRGGPGWLVSWDIDPATYLFLSFLPAVFLFGLSSRVTGLIAVFFLVMMAFFSQIKFEQTTENMAIMAFFFFMAAVVQAMREIKH